MSDHIENENRAFNIDDGVAGRRLRQNEQWRRVREAMQENEDDTPFRPFAEYRTDGVQRHLPEGANIWQYADTY